MLIVVWKRFLLTKILENQKLHLKFQKKHHKYVRKNEGKSKIELPFKVLLNGI